MNKHTFTPDREHTTDENSDITKVRLGEPMSFVEVIYSDIGEGLLTGAEMTQRQL